MARESYSPCHKEETISGAISEISPDTTSPVNQKPNAVLGHKSRSSSMGSITSSKTRSSSIVSLDSPRNSIISIDDTIRPSRNNSTGSLTSLSAVKKPVLFPKSRAKVKPVINESLYFKQDFNFKFKEKKKINKISTDVYKTISKDRFSDDPSPSPLALNASFDNEHHKERTKQKPPPLNPNILQPSAYLKKKMFFSRDLQLELLNSSNSSVEKATKTKLLFSKSSRDQTPEGNKLRPDLQDFDHQPVLATLQSQNEVLAKLNNKWNASLVNQLQKHKYQSSSVEGEPNDKLSIHRSQMKRTRSDSFEK